MMITKQLLRLNKMIYQYYLLYMVRVVCRHLKMLIYLYLRLFKFSLTRMIHDMFAFTNIQFSMSHEWSDIYLIVSVSRVQLIHHFWFQFSVVSQANKLKISVWFIKYLILIHYDIRTGYCWKKHNIQSSNHKLF